MGETVDMILDGILCEGCGEFLGEAVGYPRRCPGCSDDGEGTEMEPTDKDLMDIEADADGELFGQEPYDGPTDEDQEDDDV